MYPVSIIYQACRFNRNTARDFKKNVYITTPFLAIDLIVSAALILIGILALYISPLSSLNAYVKMVIPIAGISIITADVFALFSFCKLHHTGKRITDRDKKTLRELDEYREICKDVETTSEEIIRQLELLLEKNYGQEEEYRKIKKEEHEHIKRLQQSGQEIEIEEDESEEDESEESFLSSLYEQRNAILALLQYCEENWEVIQSCKKDTA
jgi:hypothetical protein